MRTRSTAEEHIEFQITISRDENGYRVDSTSPLGEGTSRFEFPFASDELEHFNRCRHLHRLQVRGGKLQGEISKISIDSESASPLRESLFIAEKLGKQLFDAIFTGEVNGLFHACWLEAQKSDAIFLTRLVVKNGGNLEALPWEFLYASPFKRFLALSHKAPMVRYLPMPQPPRPLRISFPLRVAVVLAADPKFQLKEAQNEWLDIEQLLKPMSRMRRLQLHRLENPTRQEFDDFLSEGPCHIIHFIGHGEVSAESGESFLLFRNETDGVDRLSGRELGTLLANHSSLRLVVLNSCFGAAIPPPGNHQGLVHSIAAAGIPAVLGMNDEITDNAARRFSGTFYRAIADREPVDTATAKARLAVYNHDAKSLEWGTPVLYMRSPDGKLFDVKGKWYTYKMLIPMLILGLILLSYFYRDNLQKFILQRSEISPPRLTKKVEYYNQISMTWSDANSFRDGYVIERSQFPDSAYGLIDTIWQTEGFGNYLDTSVIPGTDYFYLIKTIKGNEGSTALRIFAHSKEAPTKPQPQPEQNAELDTSFDTSILHTPFTSPTYYNLSLFLAPHSRLAKIYMDDTSVDDASSIKSVPGSHDIRVIHPFYPILDTVVFIQNDSALLFDLTDIFRQRDTIIYTLGMIPAPKGVILEYSTNGNVFTETQYPIRKRRLLRGTWYFDVLSIKSGSGASKSFRADSIQCVAGDSVFTYTLPIEIDFNSPDLYNTDEFIFTVFWTKGNIE